MIKKPITIIIPTWNNPDYLNPCIISIQRTGILNDLANLIIVNNGKQPCEEELKGIHGIRVITADKNLGWEGGIALGTKESDTPFVVFQNDDTFIPPACHNMYRQLLTRFNDDNVGIVAPSTTTSAGRQSIYHPHFPNVITELPFLIFYTVMVRRSALEAVGGIDETLSGGDDLDLSLRMRKANYKLYLDPYAFLIHHGFKTGERVKGDSTVAGGWNSIEMTDKTNHDLIAKHGFKNFFSLFHEHRSESFAEVDSEGLVISDIISEEKSVLEIGCGFKKTVPHAIGLDVVPAGQKLKETTLNVSVADITADASSDLKLEGKKFNVIIARHVLEHCIDSVKTLSLWRDALNEGGKLIIAVPNENIINSIPLNSEHCHTYSIESLTRLCELVGFKFISNHDPKNGVSFIGVFQK